MSSEIKETCWIEILASPTTMLQPVCSPFELLFFFLAGVIPSTAHFYTPLLHIKQTWRWWKCKSIELREIWNEKGSDKLSSDLIHLKLIWLKDSWYDANRAMFHHFHYLTFIIHHSQHKIAIYHLRKVASRVEVTKNNWRKGNWWKCMWIEKSSDKLSVNLINLIEILFETVLIWQSTVNHSSFTTPSWHLLFTAYAILVTSAQNVNQKSRQLTDSFIFHFSGNSNKDCML